MKLVSRITRKYVRMINLKCHHQLFFVMTRKKKYIQLMHVHRPNMSKNLKAQ